MTEMDDEVLNEWLNEVEDEEDYEEYEIQIRILISNTFHFAVFLSLLRVLSIVSLVASTERLCFQFSCHSSRSFSPARTGR